MNLAISKVDSTDLSLVTPINDLTSQQAIAEAICQSNWSPILFKDGRRRGENFQGSWLIVFDVDSGLDPEAAKRSLRSDGLWHILGTTLSHGTKDGDRLRIVLQLTRFIHDWPA